jgi:cytochrome b involved in lipid metabolism
MRLRALLVAALVGISLIAVPAVHAKAPVAGTTCSKLNSTQVFQGKRFTCIKSGKKLVWNKGVAIKSTPQPTATSSASSSATPSASVSESASTSPTPTPTPSSTPTPTATPTTKPTPSPTPTKDGYTMDQVKANNSSASCWSVIDGNVYDLTRWINSHPGGAGSIKGLCGIDGTQEFNRQHYGQRDPLQRLKLYLLGPLTK